MYNCDVAFQALSDFQHDRINRKSRANIPLLHVNFSRSTSLHGWLYQRSLWFRIAHRFLGTGKPLLQLDQLKFEPSVHVQSSAHSGPHSGPL